MPRNRELGRNSQLLEPNMTYLTSGTGTEGTCTKIHMQRLWVLHAVKIRKGNSRSRSPTHQPVPNIQSMPYAKHSKSPNEREVRRWGDLNRTSGRNSGLFPIRNRYQTDSEERDLSSALAYYTGSKNDPFSNNLALHRGKRQHAILRPCNIRSGAGVPSLGQYRGGGALSEPLSQ